MIKDHKVTNEDILQNNVKSTQGRRLTGDVQSNKGVFDKLPEKIAQRHNDLVNELVRLEVDSIESKLSKKINREELNDIEAKIELAKTEFKQSGTNSITKQQLDESVREIKNDLSTKASERWVETRISDFPSRSEVQSMTSDKVTRPDVTRMLTPYATSDYVRSATSDKATSSELRELTSKVDRISSETDRKLQDITNNEELNQKLNQKVDKQVFEAQVNTKAEKTDLDEYIKKGETVKSLSVGELTVTSKLPVVRDELLSELAGDGHIIPKKAIKELLEQRAKQLKEELKAEGFGGEGGQTSGVSPEYVTGQIQQAKNEVIATIPSKVTPEIERLLTPVKRQLESKDEENNRNLEAYKLEATSKFVAKDKLYGDFGDITKINKEVTSVKEQNVVLQSSLQNKIEASALIDKVSKSEFESRLKAKADVIALEDKASIAMLEAKANVTELNKKANRDELLDKASKSELQQMESRLKSELSGGNVNTSSIASQVKGELQPYIDSKIADRALKSYVDDSLRTKIENDTFISEQAKRDKEKQILEQLIEEIKLSLSKYISSYSPVLDGEVFIKGNCEFGKLAQYKYSSDEPPISDNSSRFITSRWLNNKLKDGIKIKDVDFSMSEYEYNQLMGMLR